MSYQRESSGTFCTNLPTSSHYLIILLCSRVVLVSSIPFFHYFSLASVFSPCGFPKKCCLSSSTILKPVGIECAVSLLFILSNIFPANELHLFHPVVVINCWEKLNIVRNLSNLCLICLLSIFQPALQREEMSIFFLNLSKCVSGMQCADLGGSFLRGVGKKRQVARKNQFGREGWTSKKNISYNKSSFNSNLVLSDRYYIKIFCF